MHLWYICFSIPISFTGIKRFFGAGLRAIGNVQKASARQGFLGGVVSSGAWVVPVSAGAMIGRFNNEITAIVKDLGMLHYGCTHKQIAIVLNHSKSCSCNPNLHFCYSRRSNNYNNSKNDYNRYNLFKPYISEYWYHMTITVP